MLIGRLSAFIEQAYSGLQKYENARLGV